MIFGKKKRSVALFFNTSKSFTEEDISFGASLIILKLRVINPVRMQRIALIIKHTTATVIYGITVVARVNKKLTETSSIFEIIPTIPEFCA